MSSVEANMLLRIRGDPCVKTFVQTRGFQNAVAHQAWQRGVHAACLDLKHIRLIPRVKNKTIHEWTSDARAASVRPRAVVPVKKGPALKLALEADAEAVVAASTVHPLVDQFNKIVEDMAILRAEVRALAADTQLQQAIESEGKAIESIRKAVEANEKAIESQGETLNTMQAEIAVNRKHINALLPWVTPAKLVSKRCMLEKYREMLFAAVPVNEDDSVVDLIQRVRASNPDKVVLWALDQHSSISLDIEEARAVVRDDEGVNYDEVYFRLYGGRGVVINTDSK
ncbi:hypothetical protein PF005_g29255 [Phytophthora fragariae]|uniref:Uncharacterized protein n=1 Tax=Phytophthora fragariae TaxID=53985 RepID=A0A6A3DJX9_9STRA|nr:hypothetical protein PF003_g3422 [Phytophthora fragariae]KAE8919997.1 hypothetical protein PF009_g29703 [Phytophthora fragariae]KAE8965136.1 hypothetical protein PF011_g28417 [Phytophthora fragariae]KAE9063799.1 hypothetical protein PF010_g28853 [Phytophthora fragariae]KAE9064661.1 hypothetical protein PF007_g29115 [Phytophthora fragariae]